ncbi:MAG: hypothetical protein RIR00_594 [Pseudomonadota bacterium]|jgi:predicted GNAT family N-acyltransferase
MNTHITALSTLSPEQIDQLVALYQDEWWTRGRTRQDVAAMLDGSDYLFAYADQHDRLGAFARIITDGVYKAFIFDVIVRRDLRGSQLGARIMADITTHPKLAGVRHLELYCLPEMQDFYRRFGFGDAISGVSLMRRTHPG